VKHRNLKRNNHESSLGLWIIFSSSECSRGVKCPQLKRKTAGYRALLHKNERGFGYKLDVEGWNEKLEQATVPRVCPAVAVVFGDYWVFWQDELNYIYREKSEEMEVTSYLHALQKPKILFRWRESPYWLKKATELAEILKFQNAKHHFLCKLRGKANDISINRKIIFKGQTDQRRTWTCLLWREKQSDVEVHLFLLSRFWELCFTQLILCNCQHYYPFARPG